MTCLSCSTPTALGDVALQLQDTALEAERCIFEQEKLLRFAVNRPTFIETTTGVGVVAANTTVDISTLAASTVTFSNAVAPNPFEIGGIVRWADFFAIRGIIACGATFNATASGAVTDNSLRLTTLQIDDGDLNPFDRVFTTQYETTASGGVDVSITAVFDTNVGAPLVVGSLLFLHGNTGSSVNIAAGATFWATWLGESTAVKVIGDA